MAAMILAWKCLVTGTIRYSGVLKQLQYLRSRFDVIPTDSHNEIELDHPWFRLEPGQLRV